MKKHRNLKLGIVLILIPAIVGAYSIYAVFGGTIATELGYNANTRLLTLNWQAAESELTAAQPTYTPKYSEYTLQPGQTLEWAAKHFSVDSNKLRQLNPGTPVPGTTIKITPVEHPLERLPLTPGYTTGVVVQQQNGVLYVSNDFRNPLATMTIPDLMRIVQPYNGIQQVGPKEYIILQPITVANNIRMDITAATVTKLQLRSAARFDITTLTFKDSEALIADTTITSIDPVTGKPDTDYTDGRSFVRAYGSARMDVLNSHILYLGMGLDTLKKARLTPPTSTMDFVSLGGVYGLSWRIPTGTYGQNIATGWVEKSTMDHEYIGAYTFGASGMMWRDNIFTDNTLYGLDPHDDSNNATVEGNFFARNQKHGFIVSKRCNYNIIRNNVSVDNHLHGFMLHKDSNYNLIENNISIGNEDNFVIYESHYDTIRGNKSYNPRGSHIRINSGSKQTFVQNNTFYGGKKGIYLYDKTSGTLIAHNGFYRVGDLLSTQGATRVLYVNNQSERIGYDIGPKDRVVFGPNTINSNQLVDLQPLKRRFN
jgi:parallel beta-helix repeat protein